MFTKRMPESTGLALLLLTSLASCADPPEHAAGKLNTAPTAQVQEPLDGARLSAHAPFLAHGIVGDAEDPAPDLGAIWTLDDAAQERQLPDGDGLVSLEIASGLMPGEHVLGLEVTDTSGEISQDQVSFTVEANAPPTIGLLDPEQGASYPSGQDIALSLLVQDDDIAHLDAILLQWDASGLDISAAPKHPAETGDVALVLLAPPVGSHLLTVRATDSDGATGQLDVAFSVLALDADGDGWAASDEGGTDCDDSNPDIHPKAEERCNDIDDDCDSEIDEDLTLLWYADLDGDGYGDSEHTLEACDPSEGWVADPTDCDDDASHVHPGALEICDLIDNDCDALIDDADPDRADPAVWYADHDADGYGGDETALACVAPLGYSELTGDCDDLDPAYNPGAPETDCTDPNDYNCDGSVGWSDLDADGFAACEECNDDEPLVFPGQDELCDGIDNDCDGELDEPDAIDAVTWYTDSDSDGFGDPATALLACEGELGDVPGAGDCDDSEAAIHPDAIEICDGRDNDCDGYSDEPDAADVLTFYADLDGDGWGDSSITARACDRPDGFVERSGDCDDHDPDIHPESTERCDGLDNDCDGTIDGAAATDALAWYRDDDADGYGVLDDMERACLAPDGFVETPGDCDDTDPDIHPEGIERCDGLDNDCDGTVDGDSAIDSATWYADSDTDGHGDPGAPIASCTRPWGYADTGLDCDDSDAGIHPGAAERCDGLDNDCDGVVDGADALDALRWYDDADRDGYGDPDILALACEAPDGFLADASDCDDSDPDVHPGAAERCDDVDNDCDGEIDGPEAVDLQAWYRDDDADAWGDPSTRLDACDAPGGYVADASDCDDDRADIHPDADERCDGVDNDCDTETDEDSASDALAWHQDRDLDGYGDADTLRHACARPLGWVADSTDCDDARAAVYPGAVETCNDLDDDCDGVTDEDSAEDAPTWHADSDADTFGDPMSSVRACEAPRGFVADATDCDDNRPEVSPSGIECCDGLDNDCDGEFDEDSAIDAPTWYLDADGDGHGDAPMSRSACVAPDGWVEGPTDCDDALATVNPDATETCNGRDDDCDDEIDEPSAADALLWYADRDADAFGDPATATHACAAPSGHVSDLSDCDDTDRAVHPGADELCNSKDDDCDGTIDGTIDGASALDATPWFPDADRDGYGDAADPSLDCAAPSGRVADSSDCYDGDAEVHPGATERCNGYDDDCDGLEDEPDAADASTWYTDYDSDGFGDPASSRHACTRPDGTSALGTDCDDHERTVHPDAVESCNGRDDDCDGDTDEATSSDAVTWYDDDDGDGYGDPTDQERACYRPSGFVSTADDCDDGRSASHPGATEYCNGYDDDCDSEVDEPSAVGAATWYHDADLDGYGLTASTLVSCDEPDNYADVGGDCDGGDPDVNPAASEVCNDIDDDCDGAVDEGYAVDCASLACSGSGHIWTISDGCMDDGGGSSGGDELRVYCFNGIARFCLSGEHCAWSSLPSTDDGRTCDRSGLGSDYMANTWCSYWNGHARYYCDSSGQIYFP